jgi:gamma-glutamylcysteine synthetase
MQTPCAAYEEIGLKQQGQYQQLNTNILQIENEYYASVRPKSNVISGKKYFLLDASRLIWVDAPCALLTGH